MTDNMQSALIAPVAFFPAAQQAEVTPDAGYNFSVMVRKREKDAHTLMPVGLREYPKQEVAIAVSRELVTETDALLEAIAEDRKAIALEEAAGTESTETIALFREGLDILEHVLKNGQIAPLPRSTAQLIPTDFKANGMLVDDPSLQFRTAPPQQAAPTGF